MKDENISDGPMATVDADGWTTIACMDCGYENKVQSTKADGTHSSGAEYIELHRVAGELLVCEECAANRVLTEVPASRYIGPRPTWEQYWREVGSEDFLAARGLCEVSDRIRNYAAMFLYYRCDPVYARWADVTPTGVRPEPDLDWSDFAASIGDQGFSSTERRLAEVVAALTTGHPLDLRILGDLGSWERQVWRFLLEWGTGNRCTVVSR